MDSQAPFLHVVTTLLPESMSAQLKQLTSSTNETLLENLIRFICGADCSGSSGLEKEWVEKQTIVRARLAELSGSTVNKRQREDNDGQGSNKRLKTDSTTSNGTDTDNEPSLFTLNSISTTSPVRKKVNIKIHQTVIRFYHPTTQAVEASIPLASLRRGFLIPTRGKSKPHWTIVLISGDVPEKEKGKAAGSSQNNQQVIFGLDAVATSTISANDTNGATQTIKKGDETLPIIKVFLSHLGFPIYEPSTDVFKSALPGNSPDGVPGVEAYRGAKAGNLWFMSEGILWGESKPCEFFAVEDLINKDEGLRMMSATGRTMTLIVVRKTNDSEREDDEEDVGEESQFSLIDGKEQDGINRWIKHHRHLFGGKSGGVNEKPSTASKEPTSAAPGVPLVSGPMTINQMSMDSDDEDDEDFAAKSDDESGGSGSGEEGSEGGEEDDDDDNEDDAAGSEDGDGEEEEEEEFNPENHPLLRPGAMPRMSHAAIDMVVDMVTDDFVGSSQASEEEDQLADD